MTEKRYRCSCGCLYFSLESVDYCERKLHPKGFRKHKRKVSVTAKVTDD